MYLQFTCLFFNLSSLCIEVRGFANISQQRGRAKSNDNKKAWTSLIMLVSYLDPRSQAGTCRPHTVASQISAALPACCILNKRGLGQVVFVLRTFREWQVYEEPQLDCGVHRVICTSQFHISYQLPSAMHIHCQIMVHNRRCCMPGSWTAPHICMHVPGIQQKVLHA